MASDKKKRELQEKIEKAPRIEADFAVGLSSSQVEERRKSGLWNDTPKKVTKTYWRIFLDDVFTFFNLVYFGVAVLLAFGQAPFTSFLFLIPVSGNIIIGLAADIRTRRLVDKIRLMTDPQASVMRDGKETKIGIRDIVLSEIVILRTGDQIPADGLILNGFISVNESLLTGESVAIDKRVGDSVLSGTYVQSGKAYMRVTSVGLANYAESLQDKAKFFSRPKSELKRSFFLIFFVVGTLAIVFGAAETFIWYAQNGYSVDYESYQAFVPGLAGSMVAMIPAGLYLLSSFSLIIGVLELAKKRMNVQELYCIEMLARADVLCFDKTGTLTDGGLRVSELIPVSAKYDSKEIARGIRIIVEATGDDNPTARAVLNAFPDAGSEYKAKAFIAFDSARKYSAAYIPGKGTYAFGAPGFIEAESDSSMEEKMVALQTSGHRVLGVYWGSKPIENGNLPAKMRLIGVLSLIDNIKSDAKKNIEWFQSNGVAIKIISGDDPATVSAIAAECGVKDAEKAISLRGVSDDDLPKLIDEYAVFGRVTPEQKALLVGCLQSKGHKVAMTGDGVNDVLALKKADCSIAMASGSAAARNAAHMVSLDNDFSKLPDVVAQGRRVVNNLERTSTLFLSKTFFAICVTLIFIVALFCNGETSYPFSTNNMLAWEFFTIGSAGFFLSLEPSDERIEGTFLSEIIRKSIPAGIAEVLSVLIIFCIHWCDSSIISLQDAISLSVLVFTFVSFATLFFVSCPIDRYRGIVFGTLLALAFTAFLVDCVCDFGVFGIHYGSLSWLHIAIGIITLFICVCAYFGAVKLIEILEKKRSSAIINKGDR